MGPDVYNKSLQPVLSFHCVVVSTLTIKLLNAIHVITVKLNIADVPLVPGVHDGVPYGRMLQTKTVTKLMDGHPVQVYSAIASGRERFRVVEVGVPGQP